MGHDLPVPVWHALETAPQREMAVKGILAGEGVRACFPVESRRTVRAGKTITTDKPMVSRIVYAKFPRAPQWDILRDRRIITGVMCHDGRPIVLPPDMIRAVMGLPTSAERIAAAKAEAKRIRPGDTARLTDGPLAGLAVEVTAVKDGRIWWAAAWGKGEGRASAMERLDPRLASA